MNSKQKHNFHQQNQILIDDDNNDNDEILKKKETEKKQQLKRSDSVYIIKYVLEEKGLLSTLNNSIKPLKRHYCELCDQTTDQFQNCIVCDKFICEHCCEYCDDESCECYFCDECECEHISSKYHSDIKPFLIKF